MNARSLALGLCVWAALCGSVVLAGAPMGPVTADLGRGGWSVGLEYAHEEIGLQAGAQCVESIIGGPSDSYSQRFGIHDLETDMLFGRLTFGVLNAWEVFLRAGTGAGQGDIQVNGPGVFLGGVGGEVGYDGSYGFAWGAGVRATLWRSGPWSIGGLAQMTWLNPGDSDFRLTDSDFPNEAVMGSGKIDYMQAQISLAGVYHANTWNLWAGPFLQFVNGDLDLNADLLIDGSVVGNIRCSGDLEEESQIGVHLGASHQSSDNLSWWVEGQLTSDSWLVEQDH